MCNDTDIENKTNSPCNDNKEREKILRIAEGTDERERK
jgi:hypothetical protein